MRYLWLLIAMAASAVYGQTASSYAVKLQAEILSPTSLKITWDQDAGATGYTVQRKSVAGQAWGAQLASLSGTDTAFIDSAVVEGQEYEYRVVKSASSYIGYGYLHTGMKVDIPVNRGDLLLVMEDTMAAHLGTWVNTLQQDLGADGWRVQRLTVSRDTTAAYVRSLIIDAYTSLPALKMVYLLGHVPVPYSGNINPDGHPDHLGAWPADVYYADINGFWTDNSVNNTSATDARNHNTPGDGKTDQSVVPSTAELMIGRVDFANLNLFPQDETELTRRYLERVHAYKHGQWNLPARALIDDNFGAFGGEAFASNGWRNFSSLVGRNNIFALDYRSTMAANGYLFSYGCGGGSHTSASGIGTSADFAGDSLLTGFTMLFGSYFGDWDRQDNFMRSALAQGTTMSISWAGRPHWHCQSMGLGYPLGYSAWLTQNNNSLYTFNYGAQFIHIALLGDPSLRMEYITPPTGLSADTTDTFHVVLNWTAGADSAILGYNVYRSTDGSPYFRLNEVPLQETSYTDSCVIYEGAYCYMVRAAALVENFSGSYYNESLGAMDSLTIHSSKYPSGSHMAIQPVPNEPQIMFSADPSWARVKWLVEDTVLVGEEVTFESALGAWVSHPYSVVFENQCVSDTLSGFYEWQVWGIDEPGNRPLHLFPNPVTQGGEVIVEYPQDIPVFELYTIDGRLVTEVCASGNRFRLPPVSPGVYFLRAQAEGERMISRLVIQ